MKTPSKNEAMKDIARRTELFKIMKEFMGLVKEEDISREDIS